MEYTRSQLMDQIAVLSRLFDEVFVVDAGASRRLDLETMQPTETVESVPDLDNNGRAWRPLYGQNNGSMALYWSVLLEHRPCVLVAVYTLPEQLNMGSREASALSRMLTQCHSEMCRDYVTGVYNRSFLDAEFRDRVAKAAAAGEAVSVAMVRVNEYARLCRTESVAAADRCLTTAAGILSLAVGAGTGEHPAGAPGRRRVPGGGHRHRRQEPGTPAAGRHGFRPAHLLHHPGPPWRVHRHGGFRRLGRDRQLGLDGQPGGAAPGRLSSLFV